MQSEACCLLLLMPIYSYLAFCTPITHFTNAYRYEVQNNKITNIFLSSKEIKLYCRQIWREILTVSANHFTSFSEEKDSIRRRYIKIQTLGSKKYSKNQTICADKETKSRFKMHSISIYQKQRQYNYLFESAIPLIHMLIFSLQRYQDNHGKLFSLIC